MYPYRVVLIHQCRSSFLKVSHSIIVDYHIDGVNCVVQNLHGNLSSKCFTVPAFGSYNHFSVLASIYIECPQLTLQLSLLYARGTFLWIAADSFTVATAGSMQRTFGDVPRAIRK